MPFVYGFQPVREALRSRPGEIVRVLLSGRDGGRRREVLALCSRSSVAVEESSAGALTALTSSTHQGFVAELDSQLDVRRVGADLELVVLLEDVQDPRNLGALLRVCEGAGVGKVLIRDRGSAPLSPTAIKASAGAAEWLAVERIVNSSRVLDQLKDEGFWVYGTAAGGQPPWDVDLAGKVVICFGGEEKGLRRRALEKCDAKLGLPM